MTRATGINANNPLLYWKAIHDHDVSQAQQYDGAVTSEALLNVSRSKKVRPDEDDTEKVFRDAVTVDDLRESQVPSKPLSMSPMERWFAMAPDDECFPLLAKRSMQDAMLDIIAIRLSPTLNAAAQSFTFEKRTIQLKLSHVNGAVSQNHRSKVTPPSIIRKHCN